MVSGAANDRRQGKTTIDAESRLGIPTSHRHRNEVLLNTQGQTADAEWIELCEYLHNENGEHRFVMGFRTHGAKHYRRAKKMTVTQAISWAWNSIRGKAKTGMAFIPYSMNNCKQSRWGALDFEAHEGDYKRAQCFALAAFCKLRKRRRLFVILESSGAGWHVWGISADFHPVDWWVRLLKAVAKSIGAVIRDGVCEIFPPDTLPEQSEFGCAMRAPGSWNPGTETVNLIWWQNLKGLRGQLTDKRKRLFSTPSTGARDVVCTERHPANDVAELYRAWCERWSVKFAITSPRTRNGQLCKLVGEMCHQVGHDMARRIAEQQFSSKMVATAATLAQHLESFSNLWRGLERAWQ